MPEVPYRPFPTVQPVGARREEINVAFPHVPFTKSIGQALGNLGEGYNVLGHATESVGAALASTGRDIQGAGNEIFNRALAIKHVENQTAATDAHAQYMMQSAKMEEDYHSKLGTAASGSLDAYMKGLGDERAKIEATLPNPEAQHMFHEESMRTFGRAVFYGAHHAKQQGQAAFLGALKAQQELDIADIFQKGTDQPDFQRRLDEALKTQRETINQLEIGTSKGPQAELALRKVTDKYYGAWISGVGKTDPTTAMKMLEEAVSGDTPKIMPNTYSQLKGTLEERSVRVATRAEADREMDNLLKKQAEDKDAPEKPLMDMIKDATERLPERMRDDPTAKQMLSDRLTSDWNKHQVSIKNQMSNTYESLAGLLYDKDGNSRRNIEEVFAAKPEAETWYDSLPKTTGPYSQKKFRDLLTSERDRRIDPYESERNLEVIRGMASGTLQDREKLMDMNIWDPNLKMNKAERDKAVALRNKLRANPNADPRVSRAMEWLKSSFPTQMDALGISKLPKDSVELYQFRGSLETAIETWEDEHDNIKPTKEEFLKHIAPQIFREKTWHFYNPFSWGTPVEEPYYRREATDEYKDRFIGEYKEQSGGIEPSPDEIHMGYQRELWRKYYQGKSQTKPPGTEPAPALPVVPQSK